MNIKSIEINNFLSFYGKHKFYYPNRGITLIVGYNYDSVKSDDNGDVLSSNGSGKTALCVAPLWCLYGIIDRNIDRKDDIVNKDADSNCSVALLFDNIKVERGRKPNYLRLWINDIEVVNTSDEDKPHVDVIVKAINS